VAADLVKSTRTKLSVVVPVFNEASLIRPFLEHLRDRAPEAEIIVADGRSTDATAKLSVGFCDQLVRSEPNRAVQMNVGARAARGVVSLEIQPVETRPAPETASGSGKRPSRMIGRPLTNDHWMPLERAT